MASKHDQLVELLAPVVESMECEFWGLEYLSQGKHSTLRIFVEREGGVDLSLCERVSRQVSSVMDVEDPISSEYTLEVSSPGADRPMFQLSHYERFTGSQVALKLRSAFEGRRKFSGVIRGIEGDDVVIVVDDHEYLLPIDLIEKANIVPQF